jgi:flavin reductase (DIM6/NTAB) family NADH-FMN oxidoreductase RutF
MNGGGPRMSTDTEAQTSPGERAEHVGGGALRAVMRQVPTPVTVVTARAEDGHPFGITIGSFASVSLDPPLVSFNVSEEARTHRWLSAVERFAVHVLSREQASLAARFADPGLPPDAQFEDVAWCEGRPGPPVLDGVLAVLHCRLHARFRAGDSDIVVGCVTGVEDAALAADPRGVPAADPLVYHQRGYRTVKFGAAKLGAASPPEDQSSGASASDHKNRSARRTSETLAPKSAKS